MTYRKTHCKRGHKFTPESTHIGIDGCRRCRTCNRERWRIKTGFDPTRHGNRKDFCKRGHTLTEDNVYISPKGKRHCKMCLYSATSARDKAHPEKRLERGRRYQQHNREKCRIRTRSWRANNPEKPRAWALANPEKCRMGTRNYRTRKKGNGGSFTLEQWANLKVFYGNLCLGCGRGELVLLKKGLQLVPDHILPVVLGGSSDISNIQPLCHGKGGCNLHKGAKYIDYRRKENVGVQ